MTKELQVRLKNVSVSYQQRHRFFKSRNFWALNDISLDIYKGEGLGVIGRNGAGKSTLLRLIAGIISPDKGEYENFGARASLLAIAAGFIPYLDAYENAFLGLMYLGLSRKEARKRVPLVIEFSELGDFAKEPIKNYSTGMRSRLGFAVAFQAEPDILLVDEAGAVGDIHFKKKSDSYLKEKFTGVSSLVLVSHTPSFIAEMTQRVIWIEKGRMVKVGPTQDVLKEYQNVKV